MNVNPPDYIIPELLTEHGSLLLAGSPKIGKTNLFTYLGVALSEGWPAFGTIPLKRKYKVLFLALEDNDSRMTRKAESIYRLEPTKETWSNNFIYALNFPDMKNGGLNLLKQLVTETDPDIIAVDTVDNMHALLAQKKGLLVLTAHLGHESCSHRRVNKVLSSVGSPDCIQ